MNMLARSWQHYEDENSTNAAKIGVGILRALIFILAMIGISLITMRLIKSWEMQARQRIG